MRLFLLVAVLPFMLAAANVELDLLRSLQTAVDKGKPIDELFKDFKSVFGRKYEANEEDIRRKIFETNVRLIREHNLRYARNVTTFKLGVNQFSDLTHKEYLALYTTNIGVRDTKADNGSTFLAPSNILLPDTVDWRNKGYVTPVKDQGQCGSCWAFSSTGALEGQHFKKTGKLVSLSELQLVDCSVKNNGCKGGSMDKAYAYIKQYGIEGESDYPYIDKQGTCKYNSQYVRATDTGYLTIRSGSESELQEAVATVGPIAVSIDARHRSFMEFRKGIYYEPSCSTTNLNHAVLVVGYGSVGNSDYWLVKNSWATTWGDGGYIRMARNKNNNCGIATNALYPTV